MRSTARALQNYLQQVTNVHVSTQTVRNRLHEDGMMPDIHIVPVLTAHRALRLPGKHLNWQIRHWRLCSSRTKAGSH